MNDIETVKLEYPYKQFGFGTGLDKIDYAIISENSNPEYTECYPYIEKRWNQLGIKCIRVLIDMAPIEVEEDSPNYLEQLVDGGWNPAESIDTVDIEPKDDFGNVDIKLRMIFTMPKVLNRWFGFTIARFWIATHIQLRDKILIISDGDLFPLNRRYMYEPAYKFPMKELLDKDKLVCTNRYAEGNFPATYTYGKGSAFKTILNGLNEFTDLINCAENMAWAESKMYYTEEQFMNDLYREFDNACIWTGNRLYTEQGQEINNLYDHQIDLLERPQDLAPFVEFHSFSSSSMKINDRWNRLFSLLPKYDEMDITPNCWFYDTVIYKWRDTKVTKNGLVILGDEYEN